MSDLMSWKLTETGAYETGYLPIPIVMELIACQDRRISHLHAS